MIGRLVSLILLGCVLVNWGGAATTFLKAELAQYLISRAWEHTLVRGSRQRPWPWADTAPVARLQYREVTRHVLAGAHGSALAFGPGHHDGSALPGRGHSVIAGHRDTHFRFLRGIAVGEAIDVQTPDGAWLRYRVSATEIVDVRAGNLPLLDADLLQLVTCYPFDTFTPGGPLRYSVLAVPEESIKTALVVGAKSR